MPLTLAGIDPRERAHLALCVHEAAHATVGVALSGVLRNAVVTQSKVTGLQGLTTFSDRPHGRDHEIAYAGPYGEAKFQAGGRHPTQRALFALFASGGRRDCGVLSLAGGTHTGMSVVPLLERTWPAVIRVAQQLHRVGEVHQGDVLAALGINDGGGRTSVQLASLRSGFRTVPPITTKKAVPA